MGALRPYDPRSMPPWCLDQGLALRPSERVGGQQHLPSHVHPLHTLERGPGSLVYRLWGSREPCTKM